MREVVLSRKLLLECLQDPAFFSAAPAFLFFRRDIRNFPPPENCVGCQQSAWTAVLSRFSAHVRDLYDLDPALLDNFREYLTRKLGYVPKPLTLIYFEGDTKHLLRF